jgi:hypothetical protein
MEPVIERKKAAQFLWNVRIQRLNQQRFSRHSRWSLAQEACLWICGCLADRFGGGAPCQRRHLLASFKPIE